MIRYLLYAITLASPFLLIAPRDCLRAARGVLTKPPGKWDAVVIVWPTILAALVLARALP